MGDGRSCCALLALALGAAACGGEDPSGADAGSDAGPSLPDAGTFDAGGRDAGSDGGAGDAGLDAATGSDAGPFFDGGASMEVTFPPRDLRCATGAMPVCVTDVSLRTEAERTVTVPRDMPPGTYTYVVSRWSIPEPGFTATAAGYNLDSLNSGAGSTALDATCEELVEDYTSLRDPGHVGVDNALGGLVPTVEALLDPATCPSMDTDGCLDASLARAIADGDLLLLVELSGVDSFTHDEAVQVTVYEGAVPGGGAPAVDGSGRLAPGQTFDTASTLIGPMSGDIFDGRLRVRFAGPLELPMTTSLLVPLRLDAPELRATVSPTTLDLGNVGATTTVDFLVAQAAAVMPDIEETVRAVLENVADIDPSPDPAVCERVSSGYFFDAVSASRR